MTETPRQSNYSHHRKAAVDFVDKVVGGVVAWGELGWWPSEWHERDREEVIFWEQKEQEAEEHALGIGPGHDIEWLAEQHNPIATDWAPTWPRRGREPLLD